jgi:hypothetical protein
VSQRALESAKPTRLIDEFADDGLQQRMEKISRENGIRLIALFCQVTGLKPTTPIERVPDAVYRSTPTAPKPDRALFERALTLWGGKDHIITPFSRIIHSTDPSLVNYDIGKAWEMLNKNAPDDYEIEDPVYTFTPDVQTVYNTFRVDGSNLIYYNDCCSITNGAFVVNKGLELGFVIYNFDLTTRKAKQPYGVKNRFGDGFPCNFPYQQLPTAKVVDPHTSSVFFTHHQGGKGGGGGGAIPHLSHGMTINPHLSQLALEQLLPSHLYSSPITLTPLFVLVSPEQPLGIVYY